MFVEQTYDRLVRSAMAEKILGDCSVYFNVPYLNSVATRENLLGVNKKTELYRFYKLASQNDGYVKTKYNSRDKITFRMFTQKGYPNFITLSDKEVLNAISSRHDGYLVEIDYEGFEYNIFKAILGLKHLPDDFHTKTQDLLNISRDDAKKLNHTIFYGNGKTAKAAYTNVNKTNLSETDIKEYLKYIIEIRSSINSFRNNALDTFRRDGFVLNYYGRKIYPKREGTIFNNVIQSTGSEILVEAVIELGKYLQDKKIDIMFHRFDSIFFDFSKDSLYENLKDIIEIMECICRGIPLKVSVKVGRSLLSMKEII